VKKSKNYFLITSFKTITLKNRIYLSTYQSNYLYIYKIQPYKYICVYICIYLCVCIYINMYIYSSSYLVIHSGAPPPHQILVLIHNDFFEFLVFLDPFFIISLQIELLQYFCCSKKYYNIHPFLILTFIRDYFSESLPARKMYAYYILIYFQNDFH
jgi:hypothetical protein